MKIVYVVPYGVVLPSRAAHSINVMSMCSAISDLGHELTLVLPEPFSQEDIYAYYGIKRTFSIQFVRRISSKWFYPLFSLLTLFKIIKLKPDLVLGRSAITCLFAAWSGYQVVLDSHGPAWIGSRFNRYIYLLLRNSKNFKKMTVNSNALREIYLASGIPPQCPIVVAHNGSFQFPLEDKISNWPGRKNVLQIGYAGHLYKGRGIELIIECAVQLPQYDFHIVGGSEEDIQYWKNLHKLTNIHFHGFVAPSEVYKYRNMCDVLLAPYMKLGVFSAAGKDDSSKYMNPIKLIEYMASRKALIASDLPTIREVLNDKNAVLLPPDCVQDWVKAIIDLNVPEKRKSIADQAYKDFTENLTWRARANKMVSDITPGKLN
jgi:glycosyltransferase involved in cell wall biosynthesis